MRKSLAIYFLLSFSTAGLSGQEAGNGGHLVKCGDTYRLLDFYEADQAGLTIDLGAPDLSVSDKIALAANRLAAFDPKLKDVIIQGAAVFESNSVLTDGIPKTKDTGKITLGTGCELVQFAIQYKPRFLGDISYAVERSLFESQDISNDEKAGLILHEILFKDQLERKKSEQYTSKAVRDFLGKLASDGFSGMSSAEEYWSYLLSISFTYYNRQYRVITERDSGIKISWDDAKVQLIPYDGFLYFAGTKDKKRGMFRVDQSSLSQFEQVLDVPCVTKPVLKNQKLLCVSLNAGDHDVVEVNLQSLTVTVLQVAAAGTKFKSTIASDSYIYFTKEDDYENVYRFDKASGQISSLTLPTLLSSRKLFFADDDKVFFGNLSIHVANFATQEVRTIVGVNSFGSEIRMTFNPTQATPNTLFYSRNWNALPDGQTSGRMYPYSQLYKANLNAGSLTKVGDRQDLNAILLVQSPTHLYEVRRSHASHTGIASYLRKMDLNGVILEESVIDQAAFSHGKNIAIGPSAIYLMLANQEILELPLD